MLVVKYIFKQNPNICRSLAYEFVVGQGSPRYSQIYTGYSHCLWFPTTIRWQDPFVEDTTKFRIETQKQDATILGV